MNLCVTRSALDAILAAASDAAPEECCGLLTGRPDRIERAARAANVAADPRRRFEIDPQALIDAHRLARNGGAAVIGYFHSHPSGPAEPSATDRAEATHDGSVWAIAGASGVAFWRDDEDGFVRLSYGLEDS